MQRSSTPEAGRTWDECESSNGTSWKALSFDRTSCSMFGVTWQGRQGMLFILPASPTSAPPQQPSAHLPRSPSPPSPDLTTTSPELEAFASAAFSFLEVMLQLLVSFAMCTPHGLSSSRVFRTSIWSSHLPFMQSFNLLHLHLSTIYWPALWMPGIQNQSSSSTFSSFTRMATYNSMPTAVQVLLKEVGSTDSKNTMHTSKTATPVAKSQATSPS